MLLVWESEVASQSQSEYKEKGEGESSAEFTNASKTSKHMGVHVVCGGARRKMMFAFKEFDGGFEFDARHPIPESPIYPSISRSSAWYSEATECGGTETA